MSEIDQDEKRSAGKTLQGHRCDSTGESQVLQRAVITSLRRYSTCDVSDALLKLGYQHAGFLPDIFERTTPKSHNPMPIVGRAWTVQFAEKSSTQKPDFTGHYIDQIPAFLPDFGDTAEDGIPVIPILGAPSGLTNAVFGGIMALQASLRKAPAVVVSGRIRDLEEMNTAESTASIFSRGLSTVGAGAGSKPVSIGTQCEVTDFGTVRTGEIVMIDGNGIVVVPGAVRLDQLISLMGDLTSQDAKVKESVKNGMSVEEAFKKWRTK